MSVSQRPRFGVTIIELLVVLGIGLLFGLLLTAVQSARGAATRISCANNLRQIGIASTAYHDVHGFLPEPSTTNWGGPRGVPIPWTNVILPYLEQDAIWKSLPEAHKVAAGYECPPHIGLRTVVKVYACSADGRLSAPVTDDYGFTVAYGSYLGIDDIPARGTAMAKGGIPLAHVTDGTSQSLFVGERPPPARALAGNWYTTYLPDTSFGTETGYYYGTTMSVRSSVGNAICSGPFQFGPGRLANPCDSHHFWSLHRGGGNFLFVDSSVRFLQYSAESLLPALATRAGGEIIPPLD